MTEKSYAGYYRHTDGGIYHFVKFVRLASNGNRAVEYQHVWPFTTDTWVRDFSEWDDRFKPISVNELQAAQAGSREEAQAAITAAKTIRKAGEKAKKLSAWRKSWRWNLPHGIQVLPGAFAEQFLLTDPDELMARVEAGDAALFAGCVTFGYVSFVSKSDGATETS